MQRNDDIIAVAQTPSSVFRCGLASRAPPADQQERDAGTRRRANKTAAERVTGASIALGQMPIVLAALALLAAFDEKGRKGHP